MRCIQRLVKLAAGKANAWGEHELDRDDIPNGPDRILLRSVCDSGSLAKQMDHATHYEKLRTAIRKA